MHFEKDLNVLLFWAFLSDCVGPTRCVRTRLQNCRELFPWRQAASLNPEGAHSQAVERWLGKLHLQDVRAVTLQEVTGIVFIGKGGGKGQWAKMLMMA